MARLSSEQQEEVVRLYRSKKYSIKEILALTGIGSEQTVYRIIAGRDDVEMMRRTSPTKKYSVNLDTEAVSVLETVNPRNISQWINDLIVKAGEDLMIRVETGNTEQAKEVLQGLGLEYRLSREQVKNRWAIMKYPSLDYNYPPTKELIDSAINFTLQKTNYFTLDGGKIEIEVGMKDRKRVIAALKELGIEVKDRAKNLTKLDVFKQAGLNCYIKYLTEQGESNAAINVKAGLIVRLVNKVLAVELDFIKYGVKGGILFNKKADKRPDKGRFALTTTEQQAIGDLELDKKIKYSYSMIVPTSINNIQGDTLSEYRDIFVLQCRTGQRVSDLEQFLKYIVGQPTDKVKQVEVEGQCYYEVKTKKSKGKECALIVEDEYIRTFIDRYSKAGFNLNLDKLDDGKFYNYAIKMLAKLAGIDREITYRNAQDEEVIEPAYLKLSSHCARHTFITQKLNEGVSPDKLCYLTGHTDDNMIKTIYSHLTSTDKAKMITKELGKIRKSENPPTTAKKEEGFKYAGFKKTETLRVDLVELVGDKRCVAALKYIHAKQNSLEDISKWLSKNNIELSEIIKTLIQAEVMCVGEDKAELSKWEKYLFTLQGNLLKMNELKKMWNS